MNTRQLVRLNDLLLDAYTDPDVTQQVRDCVATVRGWVAERLEAKDGR